MKFLHNCIRISLISILYIISNKVYCQTQQQLDSLREFTASIADPQLQVDNLNKLAYWYGGNNLDSSQYYSSKAAEKAININYRNGQALAYNYKARAYIEQGKFKESIEYFDKATDIYSALQDTAMLLDCYKGMSYVYSFSSNQIQSLNLSLRALKIAQNFNDTLSLATVYNNIGVIYKKLNDFDLALFYFQKSLNYDKLSSTTSSREIAVSYSNIGLLKVRNGKSNEARNDYDELFKLLPKLNSNYLKAHFYLSISEYYNSLNAIDSSKYYIDLTAELSKQLNIPQIQSKLYKRKGELYFGLKEYDKAIQFIDSCIEISEKADILNHLPEVFQLKAKALATQKKYKAAYVASQESTNPKYLYKAQKVASLLGEFEKEEKTKDELERLYLKQALENKQSELEKTTMRSKIWFAIGTIGILSICVITIIFFLIRLRKKNNELHSQHQLINNQKEQLENNIELINLKTESLHKLNATKDKFFSIIAHDLRSPFTAIIGLCNDLALSYYDYNDEERIKHIKLIEESSESTFNLLENLLYWANSQQDFIKIQKKDCLLHEIMNDSISAYLGTAQIKNIQVENNINKNEKIYVDVPTIKIVFTNIFNNAIKFTHKGGLINISCCREENKVVICINDNGIGMNKEVMDSLFKIEKDVHRNGTEQEKGTGLGLILCKEFIDKNNGNIWVESEESLGSSFFISLPVSANN
ncbi:tetratricopeptide repeat-containing sensor histidine kinase [Plebeiibacterium sediminum]|uniref:histidine kinase n=1 Tax=Plebeiibacterium sediminum TaxID=2992112 RepID=A0AAE3SEW0_9BACT|nr:tetratricopeptide repeat-containing sensor histidine kinase [Plebeiobacterium sediminum]MCW3786913.1 tetratricopeptide repeat-containing sensor histidine kinase [Plebeiobacterium sediminum]